MAEFEHMSTTPPEEVTQPAAEDNQAAAAPVEQPGAQAPTTDPAEAEQDTFIETFNKRYGTAYKNDEEIKPIFESPKKVAELSEKYKDYDTLKQSAESYKKELEDLRNAGYSEFLSKPLIRNAYVADKLLEKYPDRDPFVLQEIAMSDVDKMDDLDAVAKEQKIRLPKLALSDIKAAILSELNIDAEQKPEEWDSVAKTKLAIKAADAREKIKDLTKGIEVPKFKTKEERQQEQAQLLAEREKLIAPVKDKFVAFDEYTNGDFKFGVPPEFKEEAKAMFDGIFKDAGLEVNAENLAIAEALKKGLFLEKYLPKILETKESQVRTALQQKTDKELSNTELPNTATATDNPAQEQGLPGLSKFFQDQTQGQRATKL
jgi:hypothetical protein